MAEKIESTFYVMRSGKRLVASMIDGLLVLVKYDPAAWSTLQVARTLEQLGLGLAEHDRTGKSKVDPRTTFRNRQALRQFDQRRRQGRRR